MAKPALCRCEAGCCALGMPDCECGPGWAVQKAIPLSLFSPLLASVGEQVYVLSGLSLHQEASATQLAQQGARLCFLMTESSAVRKNSIGPTLEVLVTFTIMEMKAVTVAINVSKCVDPAVYYSVS